MVHCSSLAVKGDVTLSGSVSATAAFLRHPHREQACAPLPIHIAWNTAKINHKHYSNAVRKKITIITLLVSENKQNPFQIDAC